MDENVLLELEPFDSDLLGGMVSLHEGHLVVILALGSPFAVLAFLEGQAVVDELDADLHHGLDLQNHAGDHFFGGIGVPLVALAILDEQVFPPVDDLCLCDGLFEHEVGIALDCLGLGLFYFLLSLVDYELVGSEVVGQLGLDEGSGLLLEHFDPFRQRLG